MTKAPCKKHRYGEPDQQGYVTCWDCGDTFNLAEDNDDDDDDYTRDYVDQADETPLQRATVSFSSALIMSAEELIARFRDAGFTPKQKNKRRIMRIAKRTN